MKKVLWGVSFKGVLHCIISVMVRYVSGATEKKKSTRMYEACEKGINFTTSLAFIHYYTNGDRQNGFPVALPS